MLGRCVGKLALVVVIAIDVMFVGVQMLAHIVLSTSDKAAVSL